MYTLTIKLLSDVAFDTSVTAIKGYIFDAPRDWLGIPYIPASEITGGRALPCVGAKLGHARPDGYFGLLQAANRLQAIVKSSDTYINAFFTTERSDKKNANRRRSLKAGQVFCASVDFPQEDFNLMESFFKEIKHIGIRADDINGEVECSLKAATYKGEAKFSTLSDYHALDYTLDIISPLCIRVPYDREPNTLLYAPGRLIRREICDKIVPNVNLTITNAYIAANGKRLFPMPLAMAVIKLSPEEMRYRLAPGKKPNQSEQLITINNAYTCDFEQSTAHYTIPKTTRITDKHGNVHDALSSGQTLKGVIYGNDEDLRKLADYLKIHDSFMLGAHTDEGYGEVRLNLLGLREKKPPAEILARQFDAVCLSDTVILNDNGMPAYDANALKTEIERKLNAPNSLEIIGRYTDALKDFGLYNDLTGKGVVRRALKAGSSVRFRIKDGNPTDISTLTHTFVGEGVANGYGEIAVYPARGGYYRFTERIDPNENSAKILSPRELIIGNKLIRYVLTEVLKKRVKFLAFIDKEDYKSNMPVDELSPKFIFEFLKEEYNPELDLDTMNKWYMEEMEENHHEYFD